MSSLQESHDELARQMAKLLHQIINGDHPPTRIQLLMALGALDEARDTVAATVPGLNPTALSSMYLSVTGGGLDPREPYRKKE